MKNEPLAFFIPHRHHFQKPSATVESYRHVVVVIAPRPARHPNEPAPSCRNVLVAHFRMPLAHARVHLDHGHTPAYFRLTIVLRLPAIVERNRVRLVVARSSPSIVASRSYAQMACVQPAATHFLAPIRRRSHAEPMRIEHEACADLTCGLCSSRANPAPVAHLRPRFARLPYTGRNRDVRGRTRRWAISPTGCSTWYGASPAAR